MIEGLKPIPPRSLRRLAAVAKLAGSTASDALRRIPSTARAAAQIWNLPPLSAAKPSAGQRLQRPVTGPSRVTETTSNSLWLEKASGAARLAGAAGWLAVVATGELGGVVGEWVAGQASDVYATCRHEFGLPLSDQQAALVATGARSFGAIFEERVEQFE